MRKRIPEILTLPKITDYRGNLSFVESNQHIPFAIKRAYWIYDVPGGEIRGGHAFREQFEFIIALSGSFDVLLKKGDKKKRFTLNRSYFGLFIPKGIWRSMENFSTNSVALVLASTHFDENDYIRDYQEFKTLNNVTHKENKTTYSENNFESSYLDDCYKTNTIDHCKIIPLEKNHKDKGNITVIEKYEQIPFDIARVYYLYDVPGGEERGGHAHLELYQLLIAVSGSFDIILNDGKNTKTVTLNRPYQGLYIVPGIWRELVNFSSGSCCLVLASHKYNENYYIRDYTEFLNTKTPCYDTPIG